MNTYYVVWEILTALTALKKQRLLDALNSFGEQSDPQPYRITHARARADGQAVLLVVTLPADVTKEEFVSYLASELGISQATLRSNSNFTKLAGANTEERAQTARDYIALNAVAWGEL